MADATGVMLGRSPGLAQGEPAVAADPDFPDPDRTPTLRGPHVGELDDTHDESEPPRRRLRILTPIPRTTPPDDDVLAAAERAIQGADPEWAIGRAVMAALHSLDARTAVLESRTAPKKPWRLRARALLLAVPVSAVLAIAVYGVNAVADARVAAAADARLLLEHAQMLIDVAWLKTQVAVLDAAIDLLKLIRGLP